MDSSETLNRSIEGSNLLPAYKTNTQRKESEKKQEKKEKTFQHESNKVNESKPSVSVYQSKPNIKKTK